MKIEVWAQLLHLRVIALAGFPSLMAIYSPGLAILAQFTVMYSLCRAHEKLSDSDGSRLVRPVYFFEVAGVLLLLAAISMLALSWAHGSEYPNKNDSAQRIATFEPIYLGVFGIYAAVRMPRFSGIVGSEVKREKPTKYKYLMLRSVLIFFFCLGPLYYIFTFDFQSMLPSIIDIFIPSTVNSPSRSEIASQPLERRRPNEWSLFFPMLNTFVIMQMLRKQRQILET